MGSTLISQKSGERERITFMCGPHRAHVATVRFSKAKLELRLEQKMIEYLCTKLICFARRAIIRSLLLKEVPKNDHSKSFFIYRQSLLIWLLRVRQTAGLWVRTIMLM